MEGEFDRKRTRRWESTVEAFVRALDPFGSSISSGTAYNLWHQAQWFRGNYPQDSEQAEAVFIQRVFALEGILSSEIRLANDKRDRSSSMRIAASAPYHTRNVKVVPNLVFVLMPFERDWSSRIWNKHIKPAVTAAAADPPLICLRADDLSGQDIMIDVYENIVKSAAVIADTTNRNPNVFYELGLAHALGKRVILITQDVHDIPFDLQRFRHIVYADNSEGCERLEKELQRYLATFFGKSTVIDGADEVAEP